MSGLAVAK